MIHEPGDLLILNCPMTVIFGQTYRSAKYGRTGKCGFLNAKRLHKNGF